MNTLYNKFKSGKGPVMSREEIMAQFSMMIGIWSVLILFCYFPIPYVPPSYILGLAGLTLALLSKQDKKLSTKGRIGFICSIVGILCGLLLFYLEITVLQYMKDPVLQKQVQDVIQQQMDPAIRSQLSNMLQTLPADLQPFFKSLYGL